jgi:hypothetical protein
MSNQSSTSSGDPFTLVFTGLWDMLENSQAFVGLVAPANRIKWLGQYVDPRKDQITNSDRPQIRVDLGEPFTEIDLTTGTDLLKVRYDIVASTDKQQIDRPGYNGLGASICPVLWAIFTSLIGYEQAIKSLRYKNYPFVCKLKAGAPEVSINNKDLQENMIGWTARWPYYAWMPFNVLQNLPTPVV